MNWRERADFGFETTLSGRTYVKLLGDMQRNGYRVVLFFLWLPSADMAVARVENRVKQGGHSVPPDDIRRRYAAGREICFCCTVRFSMAGGFTMRPDCRRN